jgi:hypothetical protein
MLALTVLAVLAVSTSLAASQPMNPPWPAGTVLAGVSTANGTSTDVTAFFPDGTKRVLFVEEHAAGIVPKGTLSQGGNAWTTILALAVQRDGAEGASVVLRDANARRLVVGQRAIASQAPRILSSMDANQAAPMRLSATWVRAAEQPARSTFDVVHTLLEDVPAAPLREPLVTEEVVASIEGAWLSPIEERDDRSAWRFVHITAKGAHRVVRLDGLDDATLDVERELGKGPMRLPALIAPFALVERPLGKGRARLVALEGAAPSRERILREGIAGMDPLAAGGVVVAGAGTKRAAVVVFEPKVSARGGPVVWNEREIHFGRAGVATPLAASSVLGETVVVARLDRGRALPQELWLVDKNGARALATSGVFEVYGIVTIGSAP